MTEHPLRNSLVVKNILKFSTRRDLSLHRLVCKTWFEVSLRKWRSTATLSVLQNDSHNRQLEEPHSSQTTVQKETGITLGELQRLLCSNDKNDLISRQFLQLDSTPFARYRLKKWTIRQARNEIKPGPKSRIINGNLRECTGKELICGADDFPQFWNKLGPLMRHLHLDKVNFILTAGPTPLLLIIFHHTPKLRFLNLDVTKFEYIRGRRWTHCSLDHFQIDPKPRLRKLVIGLEFPFDEKKFLALLPNLRSLKTCSSQSLLRTMSLLQTNVGNGIKLPLRYLTIHHHEDSYEGVRLEDKLRRGYQQGILAKGQFRQLKTLSLGISSSRPAHILTFNFCLAQTLGAYSSVSSLETLKIFMSPFSKPARRYTHLYPTMYFVKHLELLGNSFGTLGFLLWMPNLESLKMCISGYENWKDFPMLRPDNGRRPRHDNHIQLFEDDVVQNCITDGIRMEDRISKKLKRFYIDYEFGLDSLKNLGRWMPHLTEFQTILNNQSLNVVCDQWKNLEKLELLYGSQVDDEGIAESLKHMKNLRTFKLKSYWGESKLGNISATKGFFKMQKLQNLEICVSEKMTPEVERQLKTKIWNATIIRNYGDNGQSDIKSEPTVNSETGMDVDEAEIDDDAMTMRPPPCPPPPPPPPAMHKIRDGTATPINQSGGVTRRNRPRQNLNTNQSPSGTGVSSSSGTSEPKRKMQNRSPQSKSPRNTKKSKVVKHHINPAQDQARDKTTAVITPIFVTYKKEPHKIITKEVYARFCENLDKRVEKVLDNDDDETEVVVKIEKKRLDDDGLKIIISCHDQATVDFVKSAINTRNTKFQAWELEEFPAQLRRQVYTSQFEGPMPDRTKLIRLLKKQNPTLAIDKWILLDMNSGKKGKNVGTDMEGFRVRFSIPDASIPELEAIDYRPFYSTGRFSALRKTKQGQMNKPQTKQKS